MSTLSKSDYKIARTCATKLYFKELGYPNADAEDDFLALLAEGGYMVEVLAKLRYPDGITMAYDGGSEEAARATREALRAENVTLFEATLISGGRLARVDILVKRANTFDLIEVKSKSFDSRKPHALTAEGLGRVPRTRNGVDAKWRPYVEDALYQASILREMFPDAEVRLFLFLPDKAKSTDIDGLPSMFALDRDRGARFIGPPDVRERLATADSFLRLIDLTVEDEESRAVIAEASQEFVASLGPPLTRLHQPRRIACKDCEYRIVGPDGRSGFGECWGAGALDAPLAIDLYKAGVGASSAVITDMLAAGRLRLSEIDPAALRAADDAVRATMRRQLIQLWCLREDREWVGDGLRARIEKAQYPLHFIDFEASQLAVPYHARMHPWERVAFQWSCLTIPERGAPREYREWINTEDSFPNVEFARTLRAAVGDRGTVFMWSPYESSTASQIRDQMTAREELDAELQDWLSKLASRLEDMHRYCVEEYCHPLMGKSTSVKRVLPAVWTADPRLREEFPEYAMAHGSPYESLPKADVAGTSLVVSEGTAAVRAYQSMLYGPDREDLGARARLKQLLLQYCRLDTDAMLMIWNRWSRICDAPTPSIF